jgi:alanine dehydrogenase
MIVGLVREIKDQEFRTGMAPQTVHAYVAHQHQVLVETGAGLGSGFSDEEYVEAGATIVQDAADVWRQADMIVKVKEPLESEYKYLREGLILFTYLHLAANRELTDELLARKVKAVAYETITSSSNGLPCLQPMSEIAGRLSVQEGAKYLEKHFGGRGILLSGVPGVEKAHIVIIGGGTVGINACKIAIGIGANVTVLDISAERLTYFDDLFGARVNTLFSTKANIQQAIQTADLVIGAVLLPGRATPKLVSHADIKTMKQGAVLVDVAVDQGGCFETSQATTHLEPVFIKEGIVHYCVSNMPGAVPRTATIALTNSTLQFGLLMADHGLEKAVGMNKGLANGVNCYAGKCTHAGVAEAFGLECEPLENLLN